MASEVNTSSPVFTQDCIYLWDKIVTFVSLCASGTMVPACFNMMEIDELILQSLRPYVPSRLYVDRLLLLWIRQPEEQWRG